MRSHLPLAAGSLLIAAGTVLSGDSGHAAPKTAAPAVVVYKSPT
jgi:hypothetical protein